MQRLEAELGSSLFVGGAKHETRLTPAGERVLAFATETLARFAVLEGELALLRTPEQGVLSRAASTIPGEYDLPALLAAFRNRYPHVTVQMTILGTAGVVTRLLDGEADVGVIGAAVEGPGLYLERLVWDKIVLAVPPDHEFARRERVRLEDLSGQSFALREQGSGTRQSAEAALAAAGFGLPQDRVALTLGSTQAILQAVAQGLGQGFVSARAATSLGSPARLPASIWKAWIWDEISL